MSFDLPEALGTITGGFDQIVLQGLADPNYRVDVNGGSFTFNVVPEPGAIGTVAGGVLLLAIGLRVRKRQARSDS